MSLSVAEARIRRLQARLAAAEYDARVVGDQILRTRQDLANFRQVGAGNNARISGVIEGCAEIGFPGAEVKVYRQGTSSLMGRFTADADGLYGGLLCLATDPQTVDVVATPVGTYAARFDEVLTPVSLAFGSNAADPIVIPPTEDWCCGDTDYFPGDCGCTADTDHVCICDCPSPFSKTASIGDDQGTHTMTWGTLPGAPGPTGTGWRSSGIVVPDVQTYLSSLGMCLPLDRDGIHDKTNYRYALSFNCGVGWKLWEYIEIVSCKDTSSDPFSPHYAWPGDTARIFQVVSHQIGFECSPDMLEFTLPTDYFGLALPGGGGPLTVVFDE